MRELKAIKFRAIVSNLEVRAHPRGEKPITKIAVTSLEGFDAEILTFLEGLVYPEDDPPTIRPAVVNVTIEYQPPIGMPKITRKVSASITVKEE